MLSQEQVDHFRAFGFVILRDYLTQDEVAQLRREFDEAMRISFAGNEFDGTKRHWIPMLGPAAPTFGRLAGDPRFLEAGRELSGNDTMLFTVDANRYVGDTGWHSDGAPSHSVKMVFYLEPVGAESGALRVVPTSHWATPHVADSGVSEERKQALHQRVAEVNATGDFRGVPAVALESEPGDVVVFDPHIFHAAVGGSTDRPMCTVTYFPMPAPGEAAVTQVTPSQYEAMKVFGATDVSQVFDLEWFAAQDWGDGHAQVIANLRKAGALPSPEPVG
jgi:ectoine hydroxylase-related dioxygenase (phytanoyl-CoA dioxygenase family)